MINNLFIVNFYTANDELTDCELQCAYLMYFQIRIEKSKISKSPNSSRSQVNEFVRLFKYQIIITL